MTAIFTYLFIGGVLGFLIGLNKHQTPTGLINYNILKNERDESERKLLYYKKVIKDLVEDNRKLVKELEEHNK
jgi:hypothetical protein